MLHVTCAPALATSQRVRLLSAADAAVLLGIYLSHRKNEALYALHLDGEGYVIALTAQEGDINLLRLTPAKIARTACQHDARGLVLAHNHPSGNPAPSAVDIATTRRLAELLRRMDVMLIDHLIFAGDAVTSFRGIGLV